MSLSRYWATQNISHFSQNILGKHQNLITRELMVIWRWSTPHFNQKTNVSICVSYNVYPSEQWKWLKSLFWLKKASNSQNLITPKPLIIGRWLTPRFKQKSHVSIDDSYEVYSSEQQKRLKWPFWPKKAWNSQNIITPEPLILGWWLTPRFKQKNHVSIDDSYDVYPSQQQKRLKWPFWLKKGME